MIFDFLKKPYSHLYILGDNSNWVLDEESKQLKKIAESIGIKASIKKRIFFNIPQIIYHTSQFSLNDNRIYKTKHRIVIDYFHGKPEQDEKFRKCFESLKKHHEQISRVRVANKEMEALIQTSGIDISKIFRIPIAVDLSLFKPQTAENKLTIRKSLGINDSAVVIGSFQKDGDGWGEGNKPKHIKGPDIFLKVIEKLKSEIPNIHILLSGPSRGFVKNGLNEMGIPFTHKYYSEYTKIADLYDALDLYIITSREEGGPKALLESMAKGVPVVTTAVGQCEDLVINRENALMVQIEDVDGLAKNSLEILKDSKLRNKLTENGYKTANSNSYPSQTELWKKFFMNLIQT